MRVAIIAPLSKPILESLRKKIVSSIRDFTIQGGSPLLGQIFFNERVIMVFISEVTVTAILFFLTLKLYGRYRERKQPATRYITFTSLFLSLTTCLQLLDMLIMDPFIGIRRVGLSLAFAASAIANIFLYLFMLEIFYTGRKAGGAKLKIFATVEAAVAILLPILGPTTVVGSTLIDAFTILLLIHLAFALALYLALIRVTSRAIHGTTDALAKRGFSYIRFAAVSIIAAYLLFVMDSVWTALLEPEGYTYWVIAGWIAAGISGILIYIGFVLPRRLRKQT
jgi:hypothetical protein